VEASVILVQHDQREPRSVALRHVNSALLNLVKHLKFDLSDQSISKACRIEIHAGRR
jgi:hypothetical protein